MNAFRFARGAISRLSGGRRVGRADDSEPYACQLSQLRCNMSSATILQLSPSLPVVTPDGKGEAIGWIDYGKEDHLLWIVFLAAQGECWIYPNPQIRACPNITLGRMPDISSAAVRNSIPVGKRRKLQKVDERAKAAAAAPQAASPNRNGHGAGISKRQTTDAKSRH